MYKKVDLFLKSFIMRLLISSLLLTQFAISCGNAKMVPQTVEIYEREAVQRVVSTVALTPKVSTTDKIMETSNTIEEKTESEEATSPTREMELVFDHGNWDALLKKYVNAKGDVNYLGFKDSYSELKAYLNTLSETLPDDSWDRNEVLAYWINAYNAFTVQLILDNYPVNSIKDIKDPWGTRFFKLGEKWYNLQEIEHKILRKMDEPRIHFAINCASFSCPQLLNEAFTAANMEAQLEEMTRKFVNDPTRNIITEEKVQLSQIFKWYKKDFTEEESLLAYINRYTEIDITTKTKVNYIKYDWRLNEAK